MGCGKGMRDGGWHRRFRGCGYRFTAPRKAIIEVLQGEKGHLSAEEIYERVCERFPGTGLATVYRTLEVLTQMGMVSKFDFGDGRARYEYTVGRTEEHHHHLICTCCRRIINYSEFIDEELEFLKRAEEGLSKKYKFEIKDHSIGFYGLCEDCVRNRK
jgi:Fur family ferric uptake transcriptional regulator